MRASDVTTLTVRMGAHNLKESAREAGVQNHGVKLVVKHKDFTMETLVSYPTHVFTKKLDVESPRIFKI